MKEIKKKKVKNISLHNYDDAMSLVDRLYLNCVNFDEYCFVAEDVAHDDDEILSTNRTQTKITKEVQK